ncbi:MULTISPECIES: ABC transporter permease [unclassified Rhizobacter]|uniref:ABC transporter permease n=1 Tax=unclassified Rhizobacter TaxID=2640088 RepID=UPI0006F4B02B|nr:MULTISPECIES: ABC transporter permease [unclassified Rhizobacter]KQU81602.1 sugar ABC transporter permease [Rhizobacter sp. Root29]KQW12068.1 sugar ABC transporter permease [Rhizobacter sp. Root1238]KRB02883.1 sugar ABC transporter permease [Rhizobacter sp. Root16D2]
MTDDWLIVASVIGATLRIAAPLVLCALAGVFSERAGVIDIGLEGKMLAAAFAAACLGAIGWPAWPAMAGAIAVSALLALVHAWACVTHRGDQIVSSVALNVIAAGLTVVLGLVWFHQGGRTPNIGDASRFMALFPEAANAVQGWPVVGPLLAEGVLRHNLLVWVTVALVPASWWLLYRTRFGLRLRAVGENPAMVDAAGISVGALRYGAVLLAGVLCGAAGGYLALAQNASFTPGMTAGRGFMALAAMVFGKWHPLRAAVACLLFGFLDAVAIRLQGVELPGLGSVPVELIQALPYLLTVVLLAGFFGRAEAPRALGRAYVKER